MAKDPAIKAATAELHAFQKAYRMESAALLRKYKPVTNSATKALNKAQTAYLAKLPKPVKKATVAANLKRRKPAARKPRKRASDPRNVIGTYPTEGPVGMPS